MWVAIVAVVTLVAGSACGSTLSRRELSAANNGISDPDLAEPLSRAGDAPEVGGPRADGGQAIGGPAGTGAATVTGSAGPAPGIGDGLRGAGPSGAAPSSGERSTAARPRTTGGAGGAGGPGGGSAAAGSGVATPAGAGRSGTGPSASTPGPTGPPGAPRPEAAAKSTIKIGSFGTQSGPIGLILANAVAAVRAWVADVNSRGGLAGHPVQLVLADDGGDPGKALAITRRMVEEEKVLALFDLFGAATMHTAVPYVEQQRVPVIGSVPHPAIEYSPVFFAPEATNIEINRAHLTALRAMSRLTKVSLLTCREADACPKALKDIKEYAPKVGFQVVHEAQVSLAQPDYTAEVLAARNAGAEAVVLVLDVQSVVRFLRSAQRQEWHPAVLGGPAVYEQAFLESAGDLADGTMLFASTLPYSISPRMAPYREAVSRWVPGGKLGDFGAAMWLGGRLFERIAPALGEPPTRQQIFDALQALRGETLGGLTPPLEFPATRTETTNRCVVPVRVENGRYVAPAGDTFVCNER